MRRNTIVIVALAVSIVLVSAFVPLHITHIATSMTSPNGREAVFHYSMNEEQVAFCDFVNVGCDIGVHASLATNGGWVYSTHIAIYRAHYPIHPTSYALGIFAVPTGIAAYIGTGQPGERRPEGPGDAIAAHGTQETADWRDYPAEVKVHDSRVRLIRDAAAAAGKPAELAVRAFNRWWESGGWQEYTFEHDLTLKVSEACAEAGIPYPPEQPQLAGGLAPLHVASIGASDLGRDGVLLGEILSISERKALPSEATAECAVCDTKTEPFALLPAELLKNGGAGTREEIRRIALHHARSAGCGCKRPQLLVEERSPVDYSVLTVGEPPTSSVGVGFDDSRLTLHLVGARPPISGGARFTVLPFANASTRKIELVSTEAKGTDARPKAPKLTPHLRERIAHDIAGLERSVLRNQISPSIVGREQAQESRLYVLSSPPRIPDVDGTRTIRGTISEVLLGDSTTGKSESAKDSSDFEGGQNFGPYIQAENAGRTGILYGIEKSPTGEFSLVWGSVPRAHGTYVVFDGLESWPSDAQRDVRAAQRDQEVRVDRIVKGRRPTVFRSTTTANPRRELVDYAYACEAIRDCSPFSAAPDIARIDLWTIFGQKDIPKNRIADRTSATRPVEAELWRTFVGWAWSRKSGDISYLPQAAMRIRELAGDFMRELGSARLPLVTDDFRDLLCRVSVSEAVLSFSTTNGEDVVVSTEHVDRAARFLLRMYDAMDLPAWRTHYESDTGITGGEAIATARAIGEIGDRIIDRLSRNRDPVGSREVASAIGATVDQVHHAYDVLGPQGRGLVETTRGAGAKLSPRGYAYFRWLRKVESEQPSPPKEGVVVAGLRDKLKVITESRDNNSPGGSGGSVKGTQDGPPGPAAAQSEPSVGESQDSPTSIGPVAENGDKSGGDR